MTSFSYWEKRAIQDPTDLLIIGSGLVGLCSALAHRNLHPQARIRVIERGIFPHGASTKNAGFACLGSPTELLDDLSKRPHSEVLETLAMRHNGLQRLFSLVQKSRIKYEACGGFELFRPEDEQAWSSTKDHIEAINDLYFEATGASNAVHLDSGHPNFPGLIGAAKLRLEGALNPWYLVEELQTLARKNQIDVWSGVEVQSYEETPDRVTVESNIGPLRTERLLLCTNGLTKTLIGSLDLEPARAQVLVARTTKPLQWKGTFHLHEGYYYFRHLDDHTVLLGGGRQLDIQGETTTDISTTSLIQNDLERLLKATILTDYDYHIEHRWAGIMAVGSGKSPLIGKSSDRVGYAVRMGGMGVAIGAEVAHRAARLWE